MRDYNLQPLSPNMVRKPPLNDYAMAAHAAAANIGSPAGLQPEGKLALIDSRLRTLQASSRTETEAQLKQLKALALRNQMGLAGRADATAIQGLSQEASLELDEAGKSDWMTQLAQGVTLAGAGAGALGSIDRALAKRDADGTLMVGDDGQYESRLGGFGETAMDVTGVLRKVLSAGGVLKFDRENSSSLALAKSRQETKSLIETKQEIEERHAQERGRLQQEIDALHAGMQEMAETLGSFRETMDTYNATLDDPDAWTSAGMGAY